MRNRTIVKEIIDTCNIFREEVEEEVTLLKGDPDEDLWVWFRTIYLTLISIITKIRIKLLTIWL